MLSPRLVAGDRLVFDDDRQRLHEFKFSFEGRLIASFRRNACLVSVIAPGFD
jgi:hypothetical protein